MEEQTIIERINTTLDGDPSLEDIDALLAEVRKRVGEVEFRLRDIRGGERQQVMDSGTPEDLIEIDREAELLEAEFEQIRRCRERLQGAQEKARKAEALESFPSDLERFDELLAAEADAAAALDRARGRVDQQLANLNSARTLLRGRRDLPAGNPETARRYCELRGIRADSRGEITQVGGLQRAQQAASALGVELPDLRGIRNRVAA